MEEPAADTIVAETPTIDVNIIQVDIPIESSVETNIAPAETVNTPVETNNTPAETVNAPVETNNTRLAGFLFVDRESFRSKNKRK